MSRILIVRKIRRLSYVLLLVSLHGTGSLSRDVNVLVGASETEVSNDPRSLQTHTTGKDSSQSGVLSFTKQDF